MTPTDFIEMFSNLSDKVSEYLYVMFTILILFMILYLIYRMITNKIGVNVK